VNRRASRELLRAHGVPLSRLRISDALREAFTNVSRAPLRTMVTSIGTALAVGTAVATVGLAESTKGAVSSTFNRQEATSVTFTDNDPQARRPALTESAERSLDRLHGVVSAGLIWSVGGGNDLNVSRIDTPDPTGNTSAELPVSVASPRALATLGLSPVAGRLFDSGMDHRHDPVALLSQDAASQLGITSVDLSPTLFIEGSRFTVVGIARVDLITDQSLDGVLIPPGAAGDIAVKSGSSREIFVRTKPGAAQLVGSEGRYAIDPYQPGRVAAQVPIDPTQLRNQINGQVTALLLAVAAVTLIVGVISIANITLLAVFQRRSEIGLRRSIGAAPRHIATLILSEALLIGGIGGLLGTSVGVFVTAVVSASRGWSPTLSPTVLVLAPLLGATAGLLAGLYPAWQASRVTPIAALQR
jgi:putative ABC transport system permease protein